MKWLLTLTVGVALWVELVVWESKCKRNVHPGLLVAKVGVFGAKLLK